MRMIGVVKERLNPANVISFQKMVGVMCLLMYLTFVCYSQTENSNVMLSLHETQIDLSNRTGENVTACGIIYSNGSYHVERRIQRMDTFAVTSLIYEDTLSSAQMSKLTDIVDQPNVKSLHDFVQPTVSPANHFAHFFNARIDRHGNLQDVGYLIWKGPDLASSLDGEPSTVITAQRTAEKALTPLTIWFHSLLGHQPVDGETAKLKCQ
jgi:hypothetical protein